MGNTQRVSPVYNLCVIACATALLTTWIGAVPVSAATPKPTASTTDAPDAPAADTPSDQPAAGVTKKKATPKPKRATKRKTRKPKSFEPDPNAKWVCDKTSASAKPVWRNAGNSVDFEFKIRNEGTAPLRIRAKGG